MNRYPDMGSTARCTPRWPSGSACRSSDLSVATGSVGLIYQLRAGVLRPRRRGRLRLALVRGLPDRDHRGGRDLGPGAGAAPTAATTSTRWPRRSPTAPRCVLVCTPNNPTGPAVTQTELDAFLAKVPAARAGRRRRGLRRVRADGRRRRRRRDVPRATTTCVLTRTFSKAYGLAGFRVGYAVAPAPIAAALRAVSLPFGVSSVAQAAAIASLEAEPRAARAGRGAGRRARPGSLAGAARRRLGRPGRPGQLRLVRARRPHRATSRPPPTRPASWSARSPARGPGSRSGRPRPTTGCCGWRPTSRAEVTHGLLLWRHERPDRDVRREGQGTSTGTWTTSPTGSPATPASPSTARSTASCGRSSPAATGWSRRRPARGRTAPSSCAACSASRT